MHDHVCVCLLCNFNSAKLSKDQIAPQSRVVSVRHYGLCIWEPFFPSSISQCSVDTAWFPFDKQSCNLVYKSWMFSAHELIFYPETRLGKINVGSIHKYEFFENNVWEIIGKCILCIMYCRSCALVFWRYNAPHGYNCRIPVLQILQETKKPSQMFKF